MAYDEILAGKIRGLFLEKGLPVAEKKMFGGLCYLLNDKMCLGVLGSKLMVRLDPDLHQQALGQTDCSEMDFTGRPMKGYVFVDPTGTDNRERLEYWLNLALDFNPKAKSSRGMKKR